MGASGLHGSSSRCPSQFTLLASMAVESEPFCLRVLSLRARCFPGATVIPSCPGSSCPSLAWAPQQQSMACVVYCGLQLGLKAPVNFNQLKHDD